MTFDNSFIRLRQYSPGIRGGEIRHAVAGPGKPESTATHPLPAEFSLLPLRRVCDNPQSTLWVGRENLVGGFAAAA